MRWWVVLCVAGLWDIASLQPTKQFNDGQRECCPCPKDSDVASAYNFDTFTMDQPSVARAASSCPCLQRSADAEGAPSAFFPTAMRAIRPFVSSEDSKEGSKPLLHPEVDLASSVLDTLREATDEEYEDALARDAARTANERDKIAAEPAHNLVTVVIKPKDTSHEDVLQEASHVHEARCITPLNLKSTASGSPDLLTEILGLPKRQPPTFRAWNLFDMDSGVGASNVNEHVVEPFSKESDENVPEASSSISFPAENYKPKSTLNLQIPNLFKLANGRESSDGDFMINQLKPPKKVPTKLDISDLSKLVPKLDSDLSQPNLLEKDNRDSPSNFKIRIPHISKLLPKIDLSGLRKKPKEDVLSRTSDVHNENREPANIIKLDVPNFGSQKSNDNKLKSDISGSNSLPLEIPNLKTTDMNSQRAFDDTFDSDSLNSASSIQERYSGFAKSFAEDSNDLEKDTNEISITSKVPEVRIVNFKNVDNANVKYNNSKKESQLNLKVPDLKLAPSKSRDAATDLLNNILKGLQVPNLSNLISSDIFNLRNNNLANKSTEQKEVAGVEPDNPFSTEILDTVPSPSEPQITRANIVEKEREDEIINTINEEMQNMIEEMPVKTEILDSIPKSSEINEIDESADGEINSVEIADHDVSKTADTQTNKSFAKDEVSSELANVMEEMNEDSIDDVIDDANNGVMDRNTSDEKIIENITKVRGSLDEIQRDEFASENKIDGLTINSDVQSLREKSVPETNTINKQNALPPLRERLRQKLENLKKAPKINIDFPRLNNNVKNEKDQDTLGTQNAEVITCKPDIETEKANENVNQVKIEDLQKMSNYLLNQENDKKDASLENAQPEIKIIESPNLNADIQKEDNIVLETNSVNTADSACIVNETSNKNSKSDVLDDSKNSEMAAGASERVASIAGPDFNLASPLRQSIILEPTSFGSNLNLFNRPNLDLSSLLNNQLPAFKIPNLLKATESSNLKLFSTNDDRLENVFDSKGLSAQASTSNFRSSLPLQPLEDINLDILQLKPISVDMPTLPRLNLNSFKTRLALPKSLDLKPVLLESAMGSENGVVGATLTLGSGKELDRSNSLQEASSSLKSSNILRQSLGTLPSLDELHENLLENAQNLLSTPLETTGRNVVEDTLRSSQVLTDNLRVQAENAVKDIQQNLASTFRGTGLQNNNALGSFRSSSDLLEDITRRHEDVNDKLKGISVDLSDRLESLRDNILDQYRIPSLGSNFLGQSRLSPLSLAIPKLGSTLNTYTKPSQGTLKFSSKGKFVTPETKRKSSSRTSKNKNKLKTASSVPVPKAIELPKLKAAPTESVFKALRKEPSLKTPQFLHRRDRPSLNILRAEKNVIDFDRPFKNRPKLGQSKVKISFSTTPFPPVLKNKPALGADLKVNAKPLPLKDSISTLSKSASKDRKGLGSRLSSLRDSNGLASEAIPSIVKAPLSNTLKMSPVDSDRKIFNSISTTTLKPMITPFAKPKSSLSKFSDTEVNIPSSLLNPKSTITDGKESEPENGLRNSDITNVPALSWPKKLDDDFLTKVRAALRSRFAELSKKSVKPESKLSKLEPSSDIDMARSASDNIEFTDPQIMKENTSYTCKMMCTKNI